MSRYEGLVTSLKEDGRAEVVIQPISSGIPGASPRVNRHVCHCATDGSTITIEALNSVSADVGDRVVVNSDTSGLVKNAAVLLGIPLMGLFAGIALAAVFTHGFAFHMKGGIVAVASSFLLGIVIGVSVFKRTPAGGQPVIDRIVKAKVEATSVSEENRCAGENISSICDGCSGRFP
jgi:positive regulator of sigma E activity